MQLTFNMNCSACKEKLFGVLNNFVKKHGWKDGLVVWRFFAHNETVLFEHGNISDQNDYFPRLRIVKEKQGEILAANELCRRALQKKYELVTSWTFDERRNEWHVKYRCPGHARSNDKIIGNFQMASLNLGPLPKVKKGGRKKKFRKNDSHRHNRHDLELIVGFPDEIMTKINISDHSEKIVKLFEQQKEKSINSRKNKLQQKLLVESNVNKIKQELIDIMNKWCKKNTCNHDQASKAQDDKEHDNCETKELEDNEDINSINTTKSKQSVKSKKKEKRYRSKISSTTKEIENKVSKNMDGSSSNGEMKTVDDVDCDEPPKKKRRINKQKMSEMTDVAGQSQLIDGIVSHSTFNVTINYYCDSLTMNNNCHNNIHKNSHNNNHSNNETTTNSHNDNHNNDNQNSFNENAHNRNSNNQHSYNRNNHHRNTHD